MSADVFSHSKVWHDGNVCGLLVADKCWRFEASQQKRKACLQYTSLKTRLEPQQIFTRLRMIAAVQEGNVAAPPSELLMKASNEFY